MRFKIIYSAMARQDLRNIYEYIAHKLLVPKTASKLALRIMEEIRSLETMPMRYQLYEEEPWHTQGIRFFSVDNYLIFYLPDTTKNIVNIVRIMYGGRDITKQLSENTIE